MRNENKHTKIRTARGAIMDDKKICDITYGKLNLECKFDKEKNQRYIKKSEVNMTTWAGSLGLDTRTLSTRLKYLSKKEVGLVRMEKLNGVDYYVLPVATEHYFDIEENTLRILVNTCRKDSLRVYLYFLGWHKFCSKKGTKFQFSFDSLAGELGWATRNNKTNQKISDIVEVLERLGLLELEQEQVRVGKGMRYEVKMVSETLPESNSVVARKRKTKQEKEVVVKKEAVPAADFTSMLDSCSDNGKFVF